MGQVTARQVRCPRMHQQRVEQGGVHSTLEPLVPAGLPVSHCRPLALSTEGRFPGVRAFPSPKQGPYFVSTARAACGTYLLARTANLEQLCER